MEIREVILATGNPGKIAMLEDWFRNCGIAVRAIDPGDAEDRVSPGYESAVNAKVNASSLSRFEDCLVVAHDSGFEYDHLDGRPGPKTKEWIRTRGWEDCCPALGSGVEVVHMIAARFNDRSKLFKASDRRVVAASPRADGSLPLTSTVEGPVVALGAALTEAVAWATSLTI